MSSIRPALLSLALTLLAGTSSATPSQSRAQGPAILIFGGGWGPEGTQVSIESHVETLSRLFEDRSPTILFAGGMPKLREVQVEAVDPDPLGELLGLLFDRVDALKVDYRRTLIKADGPASKTRLLEALDELDRSSAGLVVFGAGHGSPEDEHARASLELWGPDDKLAVDELARRLDGRPRLGPLAMVLGQCHSGAFAELMRGERGGIAKPSRCVLAAVPADRQAAGCTAAVDDPSARAYLALIAEAFARPKECDLDGDSRVSLAEAHAHARIKDETVDVPITTSEVFLETLGSVKNEKLKSWSREALRFAARSTERAVLDRTLPPPLRQKTPAELEARHRELTRQRQEVLEQESAATESKEALRRILVDRTLARWPELANPYHRGARALLEDGAEALLAWFSAQPELAGLRAHSAEALRHADAQLELEREAARLERWLRAARSTARESALKRRGTKQERAALAELLSCESLIP